jgi:hypothetical protein
MRPEDGHAYDMILVAISGIVPHGLSETPRTSRTQGGLA